MFWSFIIKVFLSSLMVLLPLTAKGTPLSFEEDCSKITQSNSVVWKYASDACPDISQFNSCVYHNGMKFSSFPDDLNIASRVRHITDFYEKTQQSCQSACDSADFGACAIIGLSPPPLDSLDNGAAQFDRLTNLTKACFGDIPEACASAGYETDKIWDEILSENTSCPEPSFFQMEPCDNPDNLLTYVRSNQLSVTSPARLYSKGCELQNGRSCRMLMQFYLAHPDKEFEPQEIAAQLCKFGNKLDCKGAQVLLGKFP